MERPNEKEMAGVRSPAQATTVRPTANIPHHGISEKVTRAEDGNTNKKARSEDRAFPLVRKRGIEPPHPCGYMNLNHARLPIPPLPREKGVVGRRPVPVKNRVWRAEFGGPNFGGPGSKNRRMRLGRRI